MTVSAAQQTLRDNLFASIDAMDAERFSKHLTVDGLFRFGSAPPVSGRKSIADAVAAFFESIAVVSHTVTKTLAEDSTMVCEGQVTYKRHDGSAITLPFADVFELDGDLISDYKIYMDIGPLYAP